MEQPNEEVLVPPVSAGDIIHQLYVQEEHVIQFHRFEQQEDPIKGQYTIIEQGVDIGEGTKIWNYVHIMAGAKIGKNCVIGDYVHIDRDVVIGNGCKIQNRCDLYKGVTLEDNVFIGPNVTFTNVRKPRANHDVPVSAYTPTMVREGATIGANSTIICGAEIGRNVIVGAGCTVLSNQKIPDNEVAVGNPIRKYARTHVVNK